MIRSLRWRIPLFVCLVIVAIQSTFLLATWREIEKTLVRAGRDRATAAAEQFADIVTRPMRANMEENTRLGQDPALQALVEHHSEQTLEAARKLVSPRTPGLRKAEIWADAGPPILEISTPGPMPSKQIVYFPSESRPSGPGVSELRASGELSYFTVTSLIHDGASPSRPIGYLRRYGRITASANVKRLIGDGGIVRIGSTTGTWTDMYTVASAAPAPEAGSNIGEHRASDGTRWVGASQPIGGTPLAVWVGYPRTQIVQPAVPFMRRMMLLAAAFVAIAFGLVALPGLRLARRVQTLTGAADEIASGDYAHKVPASGRDEVSRLSAAFNTMGDRIAAAHQALQESHDQTQFSLEAAGIGAWEADLTTGRMACSRSVAIARGLPVDAAPQTIDEFLEAVHADDRDRVRGVLEGRMEGDTFAIEYRIVTAGGAVRWAEAKGRRKRNAHGQPVSVLGVSVDVTEQRRLSAQLRQAQKMEAVGQLAGGVAHDFNNLLTAIVGHANLAIDELPEAHRVRDELTQILSSAERAATLTRQLLAFSRRQVMQPEVVSMNAVISNVEKLLRRLIGERIHIILDLDAQTDTVKVDPGHLEQVLVNLAVNARDAMPDGGELVIATTNIDVTEAHAYQPTSLGPGLYVMISVTDTGTGMDAETQAHLFEPFFTTKPAGKGTGLGLATAYGIVKQSGGSIYVYSEPGRGATFKIYLPVTTERVSAPAKPTAPATVSGGRETILVVEDNPQVQTIARRILTRFGYRVLCASSGEEALSVVRTSDCPDLVISDVIMPGMTGPELCHRLSAQHPGLRVLFTSGYSSDAIVRHGVLEPGTMFIEKPYAPSELARKVREALGHGPEGNK